MNVESTLNKNMEQYNKKHGSIVTVTTEFVNEVIIRSIIEERTKGYVDGFLSGARYFVESSEKVS